VRYFLMHTIDEPEARNEIDEVRWVLLADAPALLSYERDAELLLQLSSLA
jgi:hypothetical protein